MTDTWEPWTYRESVARAPEAATIVGYDVQATDGDIGKVDGASDEAGASHVVVDTGPWIFGRKVMLPAGTVDRVDDAERKVYIDLTKEQVKDSPELTEGTTFDGYRERLGNYYGGLYM